MQELQLYEKKIIADSEFPVQIFENNIREVCTYCYEHWHEHIEMHFVLDGEAVLYCNHKPVHMHEGNLIIINSNELHKAVSKTEIFNGRICRYGGVDPF